MFLFGNVYEFNLRELLISPRTPLTWALTPLEISRVLNTTIFLVNFLRDIVGFEHEKMLVNR